MLFLHPLIILPLLFFSPPISYFPCSFHLFTYRTSNWFIILRKSKWVVGKGISCVVISEGLVIGLVSRLAVAGLWLDFGGGHPRLLPTDVISKTDKFPLTALSPLSRAVTGATIVAIPWSIIFPMSLLHMLITNWLYLLWLTA